MIAHVQNDLNYMWVSAPLACSTLGTVSTARSSGMRSRASLWPPLPIWMNSATRHAVRTVLESLRLSADKIVKLWVVASGKLRTSFAHHVGLSEVEQVIRTAFSPDG